MHHLRNTATSLGSIEIISTARTERIDDTPSRGCGAKWPTFLMESSSALTWAGVCSALAQRDGGWRGIVAERLSEDVVESSLPTKGDMHEADLKARSTKLAQQPSINKAPPKQKPLLTPPKSLWTAPGDRWSQGLAKTHKKHFLYIKYLCFTCENRGTESTHGNNNPECEIPRNKNTNSSDGFLFKEHAQDVGNKETSFGRSSAPWL